MKETNNQSGIAALIILAGIIVDTAKCLNKNEYKTITEPWYLKGLQQNCDVGFNLESSECLSNWAISWY